METRRTSILHLVCHWNFLGLLWYFQVTETFCKDYYFIIIICFYSLYPFFSFILASILSQPLLYNFSLQPNFIVYNFVPNFILRLILCKNHDSALNHCLYIFICFKYTYPASHLPGKTPTNLDLTNFGVAMPAFSKYGSTVSWQLINIHFLLCSKTLKIKSWHRFWFGIIPNC